MRKRTKAIVGLALFGVVSLAVANNTRSTDAEMDEMTVSVAEETLSADAVLMGGIGSAVLDKAQDNGVVSERQKQNIEKSKIIEKTFQALVDNNYDPAAAVDKAAEIAVEQGWCRSKAGAKRALRNEIEKARKNESLINKFYKALGI